MYIFNTPDQNLILERFRKGEISIAQAFNYLSGSGDTGNDAPVNYLKEEKIREKTDILNLHLEEMENLIGLDRIKELVREFIAFIQIQKIRQQFGLKSQPIVLHMVFKGNPGTGKTTMARIIGKIFEELGFLKNGELIESERADLVGEYIGHTAIKTRKLINKAIGGVLFIDEAYSLARGGEKDFGKEAIDTMVKAMEDYRDNLIIIMAGYRDEMEYFLDSNPGLRSRIAIQFDFPDYTIDELVKITEKMFKEREYILDRESKHYIYRVLTKMRNQDGIT